MDYIENNLYDLFLEQNKKLSRSQQRQIIKIFRKLDKIGIYHGQFDLKNFMYNEEDKLYLIDFSKAKEITSKCKNKYKTSKPNSELLTLKFALKLRELNSPIKSFKYTIRHLTDNQRLNNDFGLMRN